MSPWRLTARIAGGAGRGRSGSDEPNRSLEQQRGQDVQQLNPFRSHPLAASLVAAWCAVSGPAFAQDVQDKPKLDVIYVPTPQEVVDRMLEMAQVKSTDFVIDLGCGDGRNVVTAAQKFGARGFGVDIDPQRIKEAKENAEKAGVADKTDFRVANLFETKISDANVMMMYLLSSINLKLRPRILDEMAPGTRIVSHAFDMGDWKPDERDTVGYRNVYLWIVPAKVDGRWTVKTGDGQSVNLDIKQQFQEVAGTATVGGRTTPILDAKLRGADISFTVDLGEGKTTTFTGRVDGNSMKATDGAGGAKDWQATKA
jgi:SAM-dependent methyltransferase